MDLEEQLIDESHQMAREGLASLPREKLTEVALDLLSEIGLNGNQRQVNNTRLRLNEILGTGPGLNDECRRLLTGGE